MTSEHKPVIIVIGGPNGSGKTSLTQALRLHEWVAGEGCVYINPDEIAQDKYGDWNSPEAIQKAAREADRLREDCLAARQSMVFETVLSSPAKVEFLERAKAAGYFIRLYFVCTDSPIICAARVALRVTEGGHTVPIEKIISRYAKSIGNCAKTALFIDRAYIYDNSVDGRPAERLFRSADGVVVKLDHNVMPDWANVVLESLPRKT